MSDVTAPVDHVGRTAPELRDETDDAVCCVTCGDYMALDGADEVRDEDERWFRARHAHINSKLPPAMERAGRVRAR